jgi:hypothetical protein
MSARRTLAAGLLAGLLAAPVLGAAQGLPGREPKVAAQALFDEAMALRKRGAHADACKKLDESLRLDPTAGGTKFYLAECLERTGHLASAWLLYTEVADVMAGSGQQKREQFARERAAALAPRLARIQIVVPAAVRSPAIVVKRDNVAVGEAQWGFGVPVDFGSHTVEARAPNMQPFSKTVEVTEPGSTVTVELPAWTPVPAPTASVSAPPPPAPPSSSPLRAAGWVLGSLGVAGFAAGGALGGLALAKQADSNHGPCDLDRDVCSPKGLALRGEAITAATGSTVAFIASGVVLAAGVVLLLLPKAGPARAALVVQPGRLSLEGQW